MESLQDFVSDTKILDPIFRVSQKSGCILTLDKEINHCIGRFSSMRPNTKKKRIMRHKVKVTVC